MQEQQYHRLFGEFHYCDPWHVRLLSMTEEDFAEMENVVGAKRAEQMRGCQKQLKERNHLTTRQMQIVGKNFEWFESDRQGKRNT